MVVPVKNFVIESDYLCYQSISKIHGRLSIDRIHIVSSNCPNLWDLATDCIYPTNISRLIKRI